jgi:hypothetical protein
MLLLAWRNVVTNGKTLEQRKIRVRQRLKRSKQVKDKM